jgi:hypothetical protein
VRNSQSGGEQAFLNEAIEAHQNGATIFVVRIVVPWREDHGVSVAMPTVAGQIEAIEHVGWRLEFFSEFLQASVAADRQSAYCVFRRRQWQ